MPLDRDPEQEIGSHPREDFTRCRQTDACLCPECYDRKYGEPPAEVAELAARVADLEAPAPEVDACPRCGYPIVKGADGQWRHDQPGDGVACELFYQPAAAAE